MKVAPIINSLNAGELSPTLDGRTDLSKYSQGAKVMAGFLPLVQGPITRRGGTRFVIPIRDESTRAWLLKFEYSASQCFHLEFGVGVVRFFTNHGILLAGALPYEVASPYADLTNADGSCALTFVQSGDVLYITHLSRTYETRKLTRYANTDWRFSFYRPNAGPLLEQNTTETTLYASASTGSVGLTASDNVFLATDVGRLVRLDSQDQDAQPWETAKAYISGNLVSSDGKTYKAANSATSGTVPPIHEHGLMWDGKGAVQWEYQDSGYGIARINSYISPTQVMADVIVEEANGLRQFPVGVVGSGKPTKRWQLGAWSDSTEFPGTIAFFRNRLFLGGRFRLWGSVPEDFENHTPDLFGLVRADCAIARRIASQDVNDIVWLYEADRLLIGTGGGEFAAGEIATNEALGPTNFAILRTGKKRSRAVAPVEIGQSILFVQRAGRKLMGHSFSLEADKFISSDLTVLADRVTRSGITAQQYQGEPYSINWVILANGSLVGFTYDQEQQVTGWHPQPIGGTGYVESISVGPSPDGTREELWLIVRRSINGFVRRYVEYMERPWEGPGEDGQGGDAQETAYYVDAGLTYSGSSASTISGLDHLEGMTVSILADGAVQPDKTVSAGSIALTRAARLVQIGLRFPTRVVPMRIEAGSRDGTAQSKTKRANEVFIRFLDTLGGKCGRYGETLDDISLRSPATPMGQPPPIHSGDHRVDFPGDYDRDCLIEIAQEDPLPMTIVAIMPRVKTSD